MPNADTLRELSSRAPIALTPPAADARGVAVEWAAKILSSRCPVTYQDDYFPEWLTERVEESMRALRSWLPDALRTWVRRAKLDPVKVTAADVHRFALLIVEAVFSAAVAQASVDLHLCDAVDRVTDWSDVLSEAFPPEAPPA